MMTWMKGRRYGFNEMGKYQFEKELLLRLSKDHLGNKLYLKIEIG